MEINGDVSHRKKEFHVWVDWVSLLGHDSAGFQCEEVTPWETASILLGIWKQIQELRAWN